MALPLADGSFAPCREVTRSFRVTAGDPPAPGDTVRVDRDVYPPEDDPSDALGAIVDDIQYTSPTVISAPGTSPAAPTTG
jgi:hypothetical protein